MVWMQETGVCDLTFDRDGNLLVGTEGDGLFRIRGDVVEPYGRAEGLSGDNVNDVFEDREGILWVATPTGSTTFVIRVSLPSLRLRGWEVRM